MAPDIEVFLKMNEPKQVMLFATRWFAERPAKKPQHRFYIKRARTWYFASNPIVLAMLVFARTPASNSKLAVFSLEIGNCSKWRLIFANGVVFKNKWKHRVHSWRACVKGNVGSCMAPHMQNRLTQLIVFHIRQIWKTWIWYLHSCYKRGF